jgi:hypothetical protein
VAILLPIPYDLCPVRMAPEPEPEPEPEPQPEPQPSWRDLLEAGRQEFHAAHRPGTLTACVTFTLDAGAAETGHRAGLRISSLWNPLLGNRYQLRSRSRPNPIDPVSRGAAGGRAGRRHAGHVRGDACVRCDAFGAFGTVFRELG